MVLMVGLEPTRCFQQQILSLSRLPFRHTSIWLRVQDSNLRLPAYEAGFLTTELTRYMVGRVRLELTTFTSWVTVLQTAYFIQFVYLPIFELVRITYKLCGAPRGTRTPELPA